MSSINLIDLNNYQKIKEIGKDEFGFVYKIQEKNTGDIFAAKISKISF
mgnify:CR=1 FL=1